MDQTQTTSGGSLTGPSGRCKFARTAKRKPETVSPPSKKQAVAGCSKQLSECRDDVSDVFDVSDDDSIVSNSEGSYPDKSVPSFSPGTPSNADAMISSIVGLNHDHDYYVDCSQDSSSEDDLADTVMVQFSADQEAMHCSQEASDGDESLPEACDVEETTSAAPDYSSGQDKSSVIGGYSIHTNSDEEEMEIKLEPEEFQEHETEQEDYPREELRDSFKAEDVSQAAFDSQISSLQSSQYLCDYMLVNSGKNVVKLPGLYGKSGHQQAHFQTPTLQFGTPVITGSFMNAAHDMNTQFANTQGTFAKKKINQMLSFETETLFKYVMEEKSESEFECRNCKEIFTDKDKATVHLDLHHPFKCSVCSETFETFGFIQDHKRIVHAEIHCCNRCLYKTPYISHLDQHVRDEHKDTIGKTYEEVCYLCGEISHSRELMDRHMKKEHAVENIARDGDFKCPVCNHLTTSVVLFKYHMLTHAGVFIYCPVEGCDFKSSRKTRVQVHYNSVHLGIRKFICPFSKSEGCPYIGKRPKALQAHLDVVHNKVRNFSCQHCSKAFLDKKHLTVHLRLHRDVKPIGCEHCEYRCCQKASLNWHMKKHHPDQVTAPAKKEHQNYKPGRKRKNKKPVKPTDEC